MAQVNAATAHFQEVGEDQAISDINTQPQWKTGGTNVMVTAAKGVIIASSLNERSRGQGAPELKDSNGKEFVKEALALCATKGEGWVEYQSINPESKRIEDRVMFVKRAPQGDACIGAGTSKQ